MPPRANPTLPPPRPLVASSSKHIIPSNPTNNNNNNNHRDQIDNQHDIVSIIEIQDALDAMPLELIKCFGDLRELDAVLNATITNLSHRLRLLNESLQNPSLAPSERFKLLLEIAEEVTRFKLGGEDKIRVAGNACEMLINHQTHISSLLQSSTLLSSTHPLPLPTHMLTKRTRSSPHPSRVTTGGVGDTPTKKRKKVVDEWEEESLGRKKVLNGQQAAMAKDKKIGVIKKKSTTSRLSPSPSVSHAAAQNIASTSTGAGTNGYTTNSGRVQRTTAGRNRNYEEGMGMDDDDDGDQESAVGTGTSASAAAAATVAAAAAAVAVVAAATVIPSAKPAPKPKPAKKATTAKKGTPQVSSTPGAGGEQGQHEIGEAEDSATYCYCHGLSAGEMIGCDAEDCPIEWFHLICLGLDAPPAGDWLCPECTKARQSKPKNGKGGKNGGVGGQKVKVKR